MHFVAMVVQLVRVIYVPELHYIGVIVNVKNDASV